MYDVKKGDIFRVHKKEHTFQKGVYVQQGALSCDAALVKRGEIFLFLYLVICLREFKKAFIADIWITKLNLAEYVSLSLNSRSELTIHVNS